jgi:hypothetical protein
MKCEITETKRRIFAGLVMLFAVGAAFGQSNSDSLRAGFANPPESARPRVWWHWMNGNITQEGIRLDLEWMHQAGLGGFQNFDAALATPQVVKQRLAYMTPPWQDAFRYATTLADQLGLEEAIAGSPGWSETGGPWVPPSQGMKKYVWSETVVEGGQPFTGTLPHPPSNTGAFQNLGILDMLPSPAGAKAAPRYYADAAVVAYRRPASDVPVESLHPTVTASAGTPDAAMLTDGDLEKTTSLPIPAAGQSAWIQYEFAQPQTIRAITIATHDLGGIVVALTGITNPDKSLEAGDDGVNFRTVVALPSDGAPEHTVSFEPVTAKYFRVVFTRRPPPPLPAWMSGLDPKSLGFKLPPAPTNYEIAELELHPGARINRFEEKAAFTPVPDLYGFATPAFTPADAVRKEDVVDLTSKMRPDGSLDWTPPPGEWVVLRFGYSLLGITNHPATPEATGLEVDKLNRGYVKRYMTSYLDSYKNTVGAEMMGARGIRYIVTDSWEAGSQNWTDDMIAQFKKRRGYDPIPWMPALTGEVVESSAASDGFLWDLRKTIADLIADEHYGQVEASIKERGMGHYGESHESGRAFIGDGMEVKKLDDIPMAAMWTQVPGVNKVQYGYNADDRESASVAHIYGQNLAAAESMTAAAAPWAWSPATLKPTADQEFLNGINRIVVHESAHQPLVGPGTAPGLTLGPFGQWFNRNETWAGEAGPWVTYLARTSYLLQQGRFAADLLYFYGEDSNLTAIFRDKAPNVPAGYGFDYINADGLIHELSVSGGNIVTPSGMSYRLLGLDPYSEHMSLPVLQAIHRLVEQGAVVAGPKPTDDPSLADDQAEFHRLADELFGDGSGVHRVGSGTVYAGDTVGEAFQALNLPPDFDYSNPDPANPVLFVHRKLEDGDLYFVDNRSDHAAAIDATFRVTGKAPELWYAETGGAHPASYRIADGRTTTPLTLEPWGTAFLVFRNPAQQPSLTLPEPRTTQLAAIEGPWLVNFQPGLGAPASITLSGLASWSENPDPGVKYFSGSATYIKHIAIRRAWLRGGARLWLDLGDVKNLADVTVNGQDMGVAWHAPYRVDITPALRPGANLVAVKVTNAWVNRLIGDQQPGAAVKYTYADVKPYNAKSPLLPSGLLGPVRLESVLEPAAGQ